MVYNWGIGIEHETMILDENQELVDGSDIKSNLKDSDHYFVQLVHHFIKSGKKYLLEKANNPGVLFDDLDDMMNEIKTHINDLENDSYLYDLVYEYIDKLDDPEKLMYLVEPFVSYSDDIYESDRDMESKSSTDSSSDSSTDNSTDSSSDSSTDSERDIDNDNNDNDENNQEPDQLAGSDSESEYLLSDYGKIIIEILSETISVLSIDYSNYTRLFEFKTGDYQNNTIKNTVLDLDLKEKIFSRCLEIIHQKKLYYPETGTVFPLLIKDNYVIDYSGSVHLNLSLPYSNDKLIQEEKEYYQKHNKLAEFAKRKYTVFMRYSDLNYDEKTKYIINDDIAPFIKKERDNDIYKILTQIKKNTLAIVNWSQDIDILKRFYFKFRFHQGLKIYELLIYYYFYNEEAIQLHSLTNFESIHQNFGKVYLKKEAKKFFNQLSKMNHAILSEYYYLAFNDQFQLVRIPIKNTSIEMDYSELTSLRKLYQDRIIPIDISIDKFSEDFINGFIKLPMIENYANRINSLCRELNDKLNQKYKYKRNTFHGKHKTWAILIQLILPLLLSVFSSCDPFSIGDGNKLTELSYHIFSSGYSFINMTDIKKYGFSDRREISNEQKTPNIIKKIYDKYPYWIGENPKRDIRGSEFRVDPRYGFGFGFELRVFDNLATKHLEPLLEFLFLLADNMTAKGIDKHEIPIDPFNHPILEIEIQKILAQGWNTYIGKKYLYLINQVLKINLKYHHKYTSYDVCNDIYQYLQKLYVKQGIGIGPYSKYLIKRNGDFKSLPNINRFSWEQAFLILVQKPRDPIWVQVEKCLRKSKNKDGYLNPRLLVNNIKKELGTRLKYDIHDLLYFLETFNYLENVKKYL